MIKGVRRQATGLAVLYCASVAWAGPLAEDPKAMEAYRGTAHFNAANILKVDLDYAVYPPGEYPNDGLAGTDPSHGTEYVYAYQVFNVSSSGPLFTIGITLNSCSGTHHLGLDGLHVAVGGQDPSDLFVLFDSVTFDFLTPPLPAGEFSSVVIFTSQNPPTMAMAAALGDGRSAQQIVPSPLSGSDIPADFDGDCDVDDADRAHFTSCLSGPSIAQLDSACLNADLDHDQDVDQADFGLFQRCFSGKDEVIDQNCLVP